MERKTVSLHVRVKPSIKDLIQSLSDESDCSKGVLIERLIKAYHKNKKILDN